MLAAMTNPVRRSCAPSYVKARHAQTLSLSHQHMTFSSPPTIHPLSSSGVSLPRSSGPTESSTPCLFCSLYRVPFACLCSAELLVLRASSQVLSRPSNLITHIQHLSAWQIKLTNMRTHHRMEPQYAWAEERCITTATHLAMLTSFHSFKLWPMKADPASISIQISNLTLRITRNNSHKAPWILRSPITAPPFNTLQSRLRNRQPRMR